MKNDLISRAEAIDVIRSMTINLGGAEIFHPEAKKSVLSVLDDLAAVDAEPVRHGQCKFCEDLDVLNQIVCYLPRENGSETAIPINFCPNCGAKMDLKEGEDGEKA